MKARKNWKALKVPLLCSINLHETNLNNDFKDYARSLLFLFYQKQHLLHHMTGMNEKYFNPIHSNGIVYENEISDLCGISAQISDLDWGRFIPSGAGITETWSLGFSLLGLGFLH